MLEDEDMVEAGEGNCSTHGMRKEDPKITGDRRRQLVAFASEVCGKIEEKVKTDRERSFVRRCINMMTDN